MLKIRLIGAESVAHLLGVDEDARPVFSDGKYYLEGEFSLVFFGSGSEPILYDSAGTGRARVEERDGEWVLVESTRTLFRFAQRVQISLATSAASASFGSVEIQQRTGANSVALINVLDISASLVPAELNNDPEYLAVLRKGGVERIRLRPRPWAGQTSTSGYYLKRDPNDDACISLGSFADSAEIDFLDELEVSISTRAEITLAPRIDEQGDADPRLIIVPRQAGRSVARVILSEQNDAGLRFASEPRDRSSRRLKGKLLEVQSNTLKLQEFEDPFLDARIEAANEAAVNSKGITRLFGPQDRFAFALELPAANDATGGFAQIKYKTTTSTVSNQQLERFFGPRVRGLGDARGNLPALDASVAVFDLGQQSRRFDLKAGGVIQVEGQTTNSILQPKLNPRTGRRVLDIPVDDLVLRVEAKNGGSSPMVVDVDNVRLPGAELVAPPLGVSSIDAGLSAGAPYAEWALEHSDGEVVFGLTDDGLSIPQPTTVLQTSDGNWLESFKTSEPKKEYKALQQHELKLRIDLPIGGSIEYERTRVKQVKDPSGKEKTAYSAFFATLSYALIELIHASVNKTWKTIGDSQLDLGLEKLDGPAASFVKSNGLKDLVVAYKLTEASHKQGFKDFIARNRPTEAHTRLLLPVSKVVGIVLWDNSSGSEKWADDIASEIIGKPTSTALAFDFSSQGGLEPKDVGWDAGVTWNSIAKDAEPLWPKARIADTNKDKDGARLDPSDSAWRGFFFHDVPASVILPKELLGSITGSAPVVKQLIELLQEKLFVEYAWRDEHGATFAAGIVEPQKITPESWDSVLKITVTGLQVKGAPIDGASSGIVQAEGKVEVEFPWWTDDGEPLVAEGSFQLDLTAKDPIKSFKVRLTRAYSGEPNIPGIKELKLIDWEFDFKTLKLVVGAIGDEDLAKALPFLSDEKEIVGSLFINLGDEPQNKLSLILPTDIETKLFGKWALSVSAIALAREEVDDVSHFQTRFRGVLDMGLPVLSSIGVDVTVYDSDDDKWELDVELQQIGIELDIGDMSLNGEASWERLPGKDEGGGTDDPGPEGRVRSDLVARAGREREFYAFMHAKGGLFGEGWKLIAKSGNTGGMTYFIGAVQADTIINLASMKLREPALLLAHNADSDGKLKKSFSDVTVVIKDVLRPTGKTNEELRKWLKAWKPSTEIGTLIAASGYLDVNSQVAKAPPKGDQNLTSIAYSDRGMFRVDAKTLILGSLKMTFAMTIDTRAKYVEAGFQLPDSKYPPTGKPQYVISPGYLVLGAGYKRGEERFKLSIGWPEKRSDADDYERDWNKSMTVKIADMVPINTFWGGVKAELNVGNNFLYLGFAIRAGWTRSYEVNGANIAKASAELGVAVGGVFEFQLNWKEDEVDAQPVVTISAPRLVLVADEAMRMTVLATDAMSRADTYGKVAATDLDRIQASLEVMGLAAASLDSIEVKLAATIYGDLWGSASLEFLGVTIAAISVRAYTRYKACGSSTAGILVLKAAMGFEVSITILCVTYETEARIDIILRDEPCSFGVHRKVLSLDAGPKRLTEMKK